MNNNDEFPTGARAGGRMARQVTRPCREDEAYDAGRLAGFEEGGSSPEVHARCDAQLSIAHLRITELEDEVRLDVERLAQALGLTYGLVDRETAADIARYYEQLTTDPERVMGTAVDYKGPPMDTWFGG